MKALIIEDEPLAARHLIRILQENAPSIEIEGPLDSVAAARQWLAANEEPQLIFSDIQLADGLSFEIFETHPVKAPIIFTTAFDEYTLRAFKVNGIDYLLKPIQQEEVLKALEKFHDLTVQQRSAVEDMATSLRQALAMMQRQYKSRFVLKKGEQLFTLATLDVAFFYADDKLTFARTFDGKRHHIEQTLDQLELLLDPKDFFRINRKYLVSLSSIRKMVSYSNSRLRVELTACEDPEPVIVARQRMGEFKDWLDG